MKLEIALAHLKEVNGLMFYVINFLWTQINGNMIPSHGLPQTKQSRIISDLKSDFCNA